MSESTGDGLRPPTPRDRRPSPGRPVRTRNPNYAARRLLVSAGAVTALVLAGLLVWRFAGGDDGDPVVEADWDEFALVDRATGRIETFDTAGRTRHELEIGTAVRQVETAGDQMALVTADAIVLTTLERSGVATFGATTTTAGSRPTATTTTGAGTTGAGTTGTTNTGSDTIEDGTGAPDATSDASTSSSVDALTPPTTSTTLAPGTTVVDDTGTIRVTIAADAVVERLPVDDELVLAVGRPGGGNVLVVRGDGDVIDVGALAGQSDPLLFLDSVEVDPTGEHIAVADARNFQTIVVTSAAAPPVFFADQPLALGDGLIATSQIVGQRAEISLHDLDGDRRTSAPTELAVDGVIADGELLFVTADGSVARLGPDDDEPDRIGDVTVPGDETVSAVWSTSNGDRLVVAGSTFEAIIDLDGEALFTTTFPPATELVVPSSEAICLVVGDGGDAHSLVRLDDGSTVADLDGWSVESVADRSCAVAARRVADDSFQLVTDDGTFTLDGAREAHVAPDGRSLVAVTTTGVTQLVPIADDGTVADAVPLRSPTPVSIAVEFLDR